MRIECYRDQDGTARADLEPRHKLLKNFIEEDVQQSVDFCKAILSALAEVGEGRKTKWRQTGNAHTLTILPGQVWIESLFLEAEPRYGLTSADFEAAVKRWLSFVAE